MRAKSKKNIVFRCFCSLILHYRPSYALISNALLAFTPSPKKWSEYYILQQPIQSVSDVIDIINRRKFSILLPFLAVFTIAGVVAFLLPPRFKASTTILIENQQIPSDLVQSTVNTLVEETIQTIQQRIMSRSKLEEIIDRFSPL